MHIVRFRKKGAAATDSRIGVLQGEGPGAIVFDASAAAEARGDSAPATDPRWFDSDGSLAAPLRAAADGKSASGAGLSRTDVTLLAPIARPGKIICIGLNYRDHAIESKMDIPKSPIMFSKYATSIVGPGEAVVIPTGCEKPDYEAEMAVVIGRRAKLVSKERALDYVLGYCCLNDVSARDFQFSDGQWTRGKAADTFAPIGPAIVTRDEVPDPHNLRIRLRLNGETMQDSSTSQLIFNVPELVSFLSRSMTLEPGDIIATGTPPGVGFARKPPVFIKPGDKMEVEIEKLGILENTVAGS